MRRRCPALSCVVRGGAYRVGMSHSSEAHQPALFEATDVTETAESPVSQASRTVQVAQSPGLDLAALTVDTSAPWPQQPLATFDLETTGREATQCRIVTASVLVVDPDGTVLGQWEWLADPGIEIPEAAAAIHGVTTEQARRDGAPAARVVSEIIGVIEELFDHGIPVLAFNASYDFTVLASEARRHGMSCREAQPVLDPYVMHKQVRRRWRGKRTLVALAENYGIELEYAHTSAADAMAAVHLAQYLAREHEELRLPAAELHAAQVEWSREQAQSFQEYLRGVKNDPTITIDGAWPLRP